MRTCTDKASVSSAARVRVSARRVRPEKSHACGGVMRCETRRVRALSTGLRAGGRTQRPRGVIDFGSGFTSGNNGVTGKTNDLSAV